MCVVPRLCTCSFPPVHEPKLLCNVLDVHGVYVFRDEPGSGDAGAAQGRRHAVPVGPAEEAASSVFTGTGERHAHLLESGVDKSPNYFGGTDIICLSSNTDYIRYLHRYPVHKS